MHKTDDAVYLYDSVALVSVSEQYFKHTDTWKYTQVITVTDSVLSVQTDCRTKELSRATKTIQPSTK